MLSIPGDQAEHPISQSPGLNSENVTSPVLSLPAECDNAFEGLGRVLVGIVAWGRTRPVECSCNSAESEAKRLELERKLMEYVQSDAYQIKMKRMKLQKYLKEIEERQKRARVRNQALLKELDEFEAHLKTSNLEMSQKMEAWYERERKRASSLEEGSSSAAGDKREAAEEQTFMKSHMKAVGFGGNCNSEYQLQINRSWILSRAMPSADRAACPHPSRAVSTVGRPERRDAAVLQTRLSNHAKHQAQLPEDVPEMLERLLLSEGAQDSQVTSNEPIIPPALFRAHASFPVRSCFELEVKRTETKKGTVTAIKSKAFWGESDDSSSEIEAALRPQSRSPEADEFDDFYD
ncbi:Kiz [Columba guinea]|nr:Kiz [Columba guinea]